MPFLKNLFTSRPPKKQHPSVDIRLMGPRLHLRAATPLDWQSWHATREQSRAFLTPWEPTWPLDALSYDYFCRNLRRHWREWHEGTDYAFLICATDDIIPQPPTAAAATPITPPPRIPAGTILGGLALTEVQRGIAQKATFGYWIGQAYARNGFMTEAAQLATNFAFVDLKLNRIEAACLPHNTPSKKLLEKSGFTLEGKARHYLRINGKWEDHLLWGKTAE